MPDGHDVGREMAVEIEDGEKEMLGGDVELISEMYSTIE